jgi:hypothetical protein
MQRIRTSIPVKKLLVPLSGAAAQPAGGICKRERFRKLVQHSRAVAGVHSWFWTSRDRALWGLVSVDYSCKGFTQPLGRLVSWPSPLRI